MEIRPPTAQHPGMTILASRTTAEEIHVWLIEDNVIFRDTVFDLLGGQPGIRCTLATGSCEEALATLRRGQLPQVVLMDLELQGMSGVEGIAALKSISPTTQVIVLTVHEDNERVFDALCAGASGYLLKPASGEKIVDAIETAVRGGAPINAFVASKLLGVFTRSMRARADYGLTDREREILDLLVQAHSQKQIAHLLQLSAHTVDSHVRNMYAKLHVHSRGAAIAKALQERLV
jgi:DNA-binding NarL/FixJ family response regulator